jgi:hypothetical protein
MDKITFKNQPNRASRSIEIHSSEATKRDLFTNLYNESQLSGIKITLLDVHFDDSPDNVIKSMIFGIGPQEDPRIMNISQDTFWANLIGAGCMFLSVLIENTTTNSPTLSMGTTPGGNDIFASLPINPKVGDKNGLTTVTLNNVFSLTDALSVFLNHAGVGDTWNNANLNLYFLFKAI